jgi:hypothetical protein
VVNADIGPLDAAEDAFDMVRVHAALRLVFLAVVDSEQILQARQVVVRKVLVGMDARSLEVLVLGPASVDPVLLPVLLFDVAPGVLPVDASSPISSEEQSRSGIPHSPRQHPAECFLGIANLGSRAKSLRCCGRQKTRTVSRGWLMQGRSASRFSAQRTN